MRSPLPFRAAASAFAIFLSVAAPSRTASAHAVIVDSSPASGAGITAADDRVALRYNSRIDHQRSRLTLVSADGVPHPLAILPDSAPDVLTAKLPGLAPGEYRLRWQVLAVDGHLTRGDIPFHVKTP